MAFICVKAICVSPFSPPACMGEYNNICNPWGWGFRILLQGTDSAHAYIHVAGYTDSRIVQRATQSEWAIASIGLQDCAPVLSHGVQSLQSELGTAFCTDSYV